MKKEKSSEDAGDRPTCTDQPDARRWVDGNVTEVSDYAAAKVKKEKSPGA